MLWTQRQQAEREVAKAMSRQIGYTTGAYGLGRFVEVATMLARQPHVLLPVLQRQVEQRYSVGGIYARGILDFAHAIGIVNRLSGGTRVPRYSLTHVGRSVVASKEADEPEVLRLSLIAALLNADVDPYYSVLWSVQKQSEVACGAEFRSLFCQSMLEIRRRRRTWLKRAMPNGPLRARVERHIGWWDDGDDLNENFLRHHSDPRRGWALYLGHLGDNRDITTEGRFLLKALRSGRERFFWLGPSPHHLMVLRIPEEYWPQPLGSSWELLRPDRKGSHIPRSLIQGLREYIHRSYDAVRLVRTNQAPSAAILPFIYRYEIRHNERYSTDAVFAELVRSMQSSLTTWRSREGIFGFYTLRK